jgi:hypothetical protein
MNESSLMRRINSKAPVAAGGSVLWIGAIVETAVGERSAQPFVEEQKEQRDLDA